MHRKAESTNETTAVSAAWITFDLVAVDLETVDLENKAASDVLPRLIADPVYCFTPCW